MFLVSLSTLVMITFKLLWHHLWNFLLYCDDLWEHIRLTYSSWDVLGIHFPSVNTAGYIQLLYNVTRSDSSKGSVSYYGSARGSPQNDVFTLTANNVVQDTLFPLISLEFCMSQIVMVTVLFYWWCSIQSYQLHWNWTVYWLAVSLYEGILIHHVHLSYL